MTHSAWRWLVASSVLFCALVLPAETRPQYGGTLHLAVHATPQSLDSADSGQPDSFAKRTLTSLLFDRLVALDESGRPKPALAESWQTSRNQRWQFRLRRGVTFDDGTPLSSEVAAASLRYANPSWNVAAENETLVVELKAPNPDLLAELALARNAIVKRDADNHLSGTGPFHVAEWQPGKTLKLAATENYWGGRPFFDAVEIQLGRDYRDQMTALQLGKADLIEVAPEQERRISQTGMQLTSSPAIELLALLFSSDPSTPDEKTARQALGLSLERGSIRNVLFQGAGQPTGGILPTWMSGYGFVFSSTAELAKARLLRAQIHSVPAWKLGYEGNDSMARLIADRLSLNARDAGLSVQPTSSGNADVRLIRVPLASPDPWIALEDFIQHTGLPSARDEGGAVEELYIAEQGALAAERVIPLLHLPATYASSAKLKNWTLRSDGTLELADAWMESTAP